MDIFIEACVIVPSYFHSDHMVNRNFLVSVRTTKAAITTNNALSIGPQRVANFVFLKFILHVHITGCIHKKICSTGIQISIYYIILCYNIIIKNCDTKY